MNDTVFTRDGMGRISRRSLLMTVPAMLAAPRLMAQGTAGTLKVRAFNHMTLGVSDPKRSLEFYQGLFGMPVQARQGATTVLRIGSGPQFVAIGAAGSNPPSITHYCLTVEDFNVDRILKVLAEHGVTKWEGNGPLKSRVRMRGPEAGGAKEGTPELYFGDPDGIVCQLQDPRYGGGAGVLGDVLKVEPSPSKGLIAVKDLSHFTISVSDSQRSNAFFQKLFGLSIRSYQGPTAPTLAIGPTVQFLMFTGGGGGARAGAPPAPPRPASINHVCLSMENFNPDQITKTLEGYGLKPRPANTPTAPMQWYISMRMENRGGAKEGTPEYYFTDPDGLLIQLQDVKYCGGGGYLGDMCRS
jgi:catechol 2,3-dioxygenase-like lactoylglutathione lyase family enzyme